MQENNRHVLYLFGAGASVNAIPVIDEIPDDMKDVANKLQQWHEKHEDQIEEKIKEKIKNICKALDELADAVNKENSITVDQYISSLYNHGKIDSEAREKCKKSRNTLALYILLRQFFQAHEKTKMEGRYGDWLRETAKDCLQKDFADKIRFLTWNYDIQLELAYWQHFLKKDYEDLFRIFNAFLGPKSGMCGNATKSISSNDPKEEPQSDIFSLGKFGMHLNGTVHVKDEEEQPIDTHNPDAFSISHPGATDGRQKFKLDMLFSTMLLPDNPLSQEAIVGFFSTLLERAENYTVEFHWEIHEADNVLSLGKGKISGSNLAYPDLKYISYGDALKKKIKAMLENVVCMVVVGYSFPMYNRGVDQFIIDCMKGKKIYIQDIRAEGVAKKVIQEFQLNEKDIVPITDTRAFYLPDVLMV